MNKIISKNSVKFFKSVHALELRLDQAALFFSSRKINERGHQF